MLSHVRISKLMDEVNQFLLVFFYNAMKWMKIGSLEFAVKLNYFSEVDERGEYIRQLMNWNILIIKVISKLISRLNK
jgi:hypothetical protein